MMSTASPIDFYLERGSTFDKQPPPSVASSHAQLSSSVLRVLSCGSEWGGAESGVALPDVAGDADLC